jgi:hypothetical protein
LIEEVAMKIIDLKQKVLNTENREYVLGFHDTGSHACYMIYGILGPKEKGRELKPGAGHEEIILAMKGNIAISGNRSGTLKEGMAFHVAGDKTCYLENTGNSEAVYIIAGGHSDEGHH